MLLPTPPLIFPTKITCVDVFVIYVNIKPNYLMYCVNGMMAPSVKDRHNFDEAAIFCANRSKPDATSDFRQNLF